jgi:hypothetical protein
MMGLNGNSRNASSSKMGLSMKVNGIELQAKEMEEVFKFGQMDQGTKGIGKMIKLTEEED